MWLVLTSETGGALNVLKKMFFFSNTGAVALTRGTRNGSSAPPSPAVPAKENERGCAARSSTQNYSRLLLYSQSSTGMLKKWLKAYFSAQLRPQRHEFCIPVSV